MKKFTFISPPNSTSKFDFVFDINKSSKSYAARVQPPLPMNDDEWTCKSCTPHFGPPKAHNTASGVGASLLYEKYFIPVLKRPYSGSVTIGERDEIALTL